ncbi:MAG: polysaccharide biosynthesis tyrosine autokinase [Candidatus Hydrogenedentota bacterium]
MNSTFSTEHSTFATEYGGGAGRAGGGGGHLGIRRILRQGAPLIIGLFLGLAIPSVVAIWFLMPTEYTVSADLRFLMNDPTIMSGGDRRTAASFDKWLTTQLAMIQGPAVLNRVIANPEVRRLPEIANAKDPLAFVQSKVRAQSKRNSELVSITAYMSDPKSAAVLVSTVISEYTDFAAAQESNMQGDIIGALNNEKSTQQVALDNYRALIRDLSEQLGVPVDSLKQTGPSDTDPFRGALADAEAQIEATNKAVEDTQSKIDRVGGALEKFKTSPYEPLYELSIEANVDRDGRVTSIRARHQDAKVEWDLAKSKSQAGHPQLKGLESTVENLSSQLRDIEKDVREESLQGIQALLREELESRTRYKEAAEAQQQVALGRIEEHKKAQLAMSSTKAELDELQIKADQSQDRVQKLQDQIDNMMVEQNAPARTSKMSDPVIPESPDYSRKFQLMALAVLASLVAGFGAAIVKELTNQHARSVQDLASITPLPVLASVPDGRHEKLPKGYQPALLTADHPDSPSADEYRRILARIIYPPDDTLEVNSCMITSATRGDGKTTLACNLAVSLSQANRRVLLVDVCPRDPAIEKEFGHDPGEGLAEVLFDDVSYQMLARPTEFEGLMVLGPGLAADNLKSKLASREMMEFLETAEKEYDHVIIDTPPCLLMSDAKLLAPIVDGIIVAVGSGKSSLGMVRRCLSELDQVSANIIGLVLNSVKHTRGGYLAKNVQLYYGYDSGRTNGKAHRDIPEMMFQNSQTSTGPAVMLVSGDSDDDVGDAGHDRDDEFDRI